MERELEEVKLENDREEGEEKARNDAVADGLNRARAARMRHTAWATLPALPAGIETTCRSA